MRVWLMFFLVSVSALPAAEGILDFQSRIEIQKNGDLAVTETLTVQAEGDQIKHGIYRDFPTLYEGRYGLAVKVPFEVGEVTRDGRTEPWHTASRENGIRLYLGDKDTTVPPGKSVYRISYRTSRQLGFFPDHDELYWNVTGNGWAFPIQEVTAEVVLPPGAMAGEATAYTGAQDVQGTDWRVDRSGDGKVVFRTTKILPPGEGLTVMVAWPKGFVTEPTDKEIFCEAIRANLGVTSGVVGLMAVMVYFFATWMVCGRDPVPQTIIPLYAPPEGLTPAAVRYIRGLGKFDDDSVAAEVLHLAVLGVLTISGGGAKKFVIRRPERAKAAPEVDGDFQNALLGSRQELVFDQGQHSVFQAARKALRAAIGRQCDRIYFVRNTHLWVVGLLFTLIPLAISLWDVRESAEALFVLVWLSFWSVGVVAMWKQIGLKWRETGWKRVLGLPATMLMALPFFGAWLVGGAALIWMTSFWVAGIYFSGLLLLAVFHHLLKRPTMEGRRVLDEIEGFRRYLSVAEADRLNLENPPERTPELFEKFLPYALALGVSQRWSEQFSGLLGEADRPTAEHSGLAFSHGATAALGAGLGTALAGAISSSSTAPGSSSGGSGGGGGGGGSSGGGGGGGGGGGW